MRKILIQKKIRNFINENIEDFSEENFKDALSDLATIDLEDDQFGFPNLTNKEQNHLFGGNNYDVYIINRDELPVSGPFELTIYDNDDELIGLMRGTKSTNTISFNMTHITPDNRGQGIGTDIYEKFLKNGFIIKSDKEITDSTYNIYLKLLSYGYKPIIYDDGRVGLKQ